MSIIWSVEEMQSILWMQFVLSYTANDANVPFALENERISKEKFATFLGRQP